VSPAAQELRNKLKAEFDVGRKAFHDSMTTTQTHIDVAGADLARLRANLKTQAAATRAATGLRVEELTRMLDAARDEQQGKIEDYLTTLQRDMGSLNAELKSATAGERADLELTAKAMRKEWDSTRAALTASLEAELSELKERIGSVRAAAAGTREAAKTTVRTRTADLHAKSEVAQKRLHALKQAGEAAFNEIHHGARAAMIDLRIAVERARADIHAA